MSAPVGVFRVLLICTANQCRSPLAERFLDQAQRRSALGWKVMSAGTAAQDGLHPHPFTRQILAEEGISLPDAWFTSRVTREMVTASSLILTATTEHRRDVVRLAPTAVNRTFPLLQFARFASALGAGSVGSGPELLAEARAVRARLQPVAPGADDLPDPIGRPLRVHRVTGQRIEHAVAAIVSPISR